MSKAPNVQPCKTDEYICKQSKYKQAGRLPMRSMLVSPSGGGTIGLIQNMMIDIYRNCLSIMCILALF